MLDTVHVLAGVVAGKYVSHPVWAFVVGVISHYVFDWLPHWDGEKNERLPGAKYRTDTEQGAQRKGLTQSGRRLLYCDMLATVLIFLFFTALGAVPKFWDVPAVLAFMQTRTSVVAGFFGALLPDLFLLLHLSFGWQKPKWLFALDFHKNIQARHMKKIPGLVVQGIVVAVLIALFVI